MELYSSFIIGGVFFTLTSAFLLVRRRQNRFRARILACVQLALGWYALLYLLVLSGDILSVPWLFRLGAPIYYIVPPFTYFYCRSVLKGEDMLSARDYLHLLPVLLGYIDLLPYFLLPMEVKIQLLESIVSKPALSFQVASGFLPPLTHFLCRPLQGLLYLPVLWQLALAARKKGEQIPPKKVRWVLWFISLSTLLYGTFAVITFRGYVALTTESQVLYANGTMVLFIVFLFFIFAASLFFWPTVLYGFGSQSKAELAGSKPLDATHLAEAELFVPPADEEPVMNSEKEEEYVISEKLLQEYALSLKEVILQQELYRNQKLSVNQLSVMLGIPAKTLSHVINHHYQMRFNDYINSFRVSYVIGRFNAGDWRDLSMEGLGREAGFSSRTTFFNAFKKHTGTSPSDYLKNQQYPPIAS
ncbi:helix-turn-helix domain-containing protein [Desertivirga xinjiangensis]|uniref:helix-turn-helix domain-containing protein n=1 Tax=Desertivirga xinjiangensis TaxID=539206 RepID=UPI00210CBF56|nr:helix-turn-helix domain-containing protein [Pedobacter xinjiangensis]